jgi:hypothetical protein
MNTQLAYIHVFVKYKKFNILKNVAIIYFLKIESGEGED